MSKQEILENLNTVYGTGGKKIISADGESFRIELEPERINLTPEDIERYFSPQIAEVLLKMDPDHVKERVFLDEKRVREIFQNGDSIQPGYEEMQNAVYEFEETKEKEDTIPKRRRED